MAEIPGNYDLFGRPGFTNLTIETLQADGTLQGYLLSGSDHIEVRGSYNVATRQIQFNDAKFPGEVLLTTFFTGKLIPGNLLIFYGTWSEQTLNFQNRKIGGARVITGEWSAIQGAPIR